ncbi:MAG TPA: methyltransferase [Polyangia bacterium]|nr:methyltransferase [Polyangia bacterium]
MNPIDYRELHDTTTGAPLTFEAPPAVRSEPTPDKILRLGLAFQASKTLLSAIELGVFTELAKQPLDADALTARLALHGRGARDFFDALVALGMLDRTDGVYRNTAESDRFLDRAKPTYVGAMLELADARLYRFWRSLTQALKSGQPQNEARGGGDFYRALYADPVQLRKFLKGMTGLSLGTARAMAKKFPFREYRTVVDVGTAEGALPVELCLEHRHLRGGGFDIAACAPLFDEYVAGFGLAERLRFHGGDFFADPLPRADVLIMGHILHVWSRDEKRMLIGKAFDALPSGGSLIVYDAIIDDDRRSNVYGLLSSLNMLIETKAGFDYTGADCITWMRDAGFRHTRVEHLLGSDSMVIGVK